MYEIHGNTSTFNLNTDLSDDTNIPEPPEQWSIEDFADILPYARYDQ